MLFRTQLKSHLLRRALLAQSVKWPTPRFGSGHDLIAGEFKFKFAPVSNYYTQGLDTIFKGFKKGKEVQEAAITLDHRGSNYNHKKGLEDGKLLGSQRDKGS